MQPETQNQQPVFTGNTGAISQQNSVLRSTYLLLAVSLIPTIVGAGLGTSVFNIAGLMRGVGPIIASIAVIAIFYGWIYMIEKNKNSSLGLYLLLGFTFFMGLLMGPLLQKTMGLRNGGQLVMMAAGGTAGVFFILSGIAANAKRDFSFLNKFIMVGVIVAMLAVVANIFLQVPALTLALSGVFIILSSAIILWQINDIVRGGETNYISATLTLYVSIYNIFTSLLQILGIVGEGAYGIVYTAKNKETGDIGKNSKHSHYSRHQEIQRVRRRRDSEEDDLQGGQNAQDAQAREHYSTQGGF